jgi:pyrroline-5-carboxylate reductase
MAMGHEERTMTGAETGTDGSAAHPPRRLAIVGAGKMGGPIALRVVESGLLAAERVAVSDIAPAARAALAERLGVSTFADNVAAIQEASTIVLAVLPQGMSDVLASLRGRLAPDQLVVSIAAGVTLSTLSAGLEHPAIVRVMPNAPAQVGEGISAWFASPVVTPSQKAEVRAVLRCIGRELEVDDERYLDMVTAVSGSGPAWVMLVLEAMIDAGVQIGLRPDWSRELVYQTVSGSIALARQTGKHPAELRNLVTSPGGTTAAGLYAMERAGLRAAVAGGIVAAFERSLALGAAARTPGQR